MTHGSTIRGGRLLRAALVICLALIVVITQAALVSAAGTPGLADLADLFPGADSIDPANGQEPRAVLRAGNVVGWVFSSAAVVASSGFSGRPVDVWVGLRRDGIITGVRLVEHHEPILGAGVDEAALRIFIAQYRGRDIRAVGVALAPVGAAVPRPISGATISSIVLDDAILRSTRAVARGQGVLTPPANSGLDLESSEPQDFATLLAEGSIAQLRLTLAGLAAAAPAMRLDGLPDSLFIALYAAPLAPARIGRNLLGDRDYAALMASLPAGAQPILLASTGRYSFKGTSFVRTGRFERIRIIQGERGHAVLATQHRRLDTLRAAGSADLTEIGLFILPPEAGLDLSRPWQVELLIAQPASDGADVLTTVPLEYRLPTRYRIAAVPSPGGPPAVPTGGVALPPTPDVPTLLDLLTPDDSTRERPLWERTWRAAPVRITILTGALTLLCALLFVQDWLVKRRTRHIVVRASFLAFTLLWLGWYSGTQLSVVNVLTFVNAVLTGFRWEFFLLDPMAFILWSAVAVWLLFLGRGVFCGWLCPFGALQEFTGTLARRLRLPQVRVPFLLHERMWPAKYMLLLGLVALSLQSLDGALPWTEIEPFKAAIVLRFARPPGVLPFVLAYLAVLLVASLFVERAFCRYICPLGAALAIPARLRMFEWLRRRTQCGTQCQICASRCPVLAIHPDGHINPNECIHCLGCQVNFYDATVCPPLIERQKRRADRREAMNA